MNRVRNILWARRNAGPVNHIAGDVHYLALGLPKHRTILTIADCVSLIRNRGLKKWLLRLFWYRLPVRRATLVTTISEFTKQQLLKFVNCDPSKIHPIHCPISDGFKARPKPFDARQPVILQVGTGWNKNLCRVARALEGMPCKLEIIGPLDGRHRNELSKAGIDFSAHDSVSAEALVSLYEQCDLLVFASTYEGFGLPIIEAQAVGRPVITSNLCSMPEVAGEGACFVDPLDVESIRNGVVNVVENAEYRESLVSLGFINVKRFSGRILAGRFARVYWNLNDSTPQKLSATIN